MRAERTCLGHLIWLGLALTIALGLTPQSSSAAADKRTRLLREALARPIPGEGIRISVVLREPAFGTSRVRRPERIRTRRGAVIKRVKRGHLDIRHRYRWLSGFSGWADAEAIEILRNDPDVLSVDVDRIAYAALTQGVALIGADTSHALGVTGSGVTVAMLDTGVDTNHPDLASSLIAEACFCNDAPGPSGCCPGGGDTQTGAGAAEDDDGHGSATAGVIFSSAVSNLGVAPDASMVAIKVLGADGNGNFSDIASGLNWVIDNRVTYGIKIVNLSLSDGLEYDSAAASPCTGSNTANAISQLKALGVSVFAASGNDGHDNGISFPACVPEAISVGGVYDATFPSVAWSVCTDSPATVDTFVCHSNSGSLLDLLAPQFKARVPNVGGGLQNFGGTSIASPYAAGQAALLLDANSSLTPNQILFSLTAGAPLVTNPDNGLSFPRTRIDLAVALILGTCGNGTVDPGEDCDDSNTLPGDCCDATCQYEGAGSSCDDADLCTTSDVCDGAGSCVGSEPPDCDDDNVCTDDSCVPETGCQSDPNTAECDDANVCTEGDVCIATVCTPGVALDCDDQNVCTADGCDEVTGCFHAIIEGCVTQPVPGFTASGLVLLVGFMSLAALWAVRVRERASAVAVDRTTGN